MQHLGLLPTLHIKRAQVVRWLVPPTGRLKLNTDAAVGRQFAGGGAILHDSSGACVGALSFRLPMSSPFLAETQADLFGLLFFLSAYPHIILETDCQQLSRVLS